MIDFQPSEDQALMQGSIGDFAKKTIAPHVRRFEEARALPDDVRRQAHELGLGMLAVPEACGGQGLGLVTQVLLEEEIAAADAAAAFALPGPHAFATAIVELGTPEQAAELLADFGAPDAHDRYGAVAWSEPAPNRERAGFTTTATPKGDGWVLDGKKAFVGNASLADRFVVFAQVDAAAGWAGIGAFVVRKDAAGLTIGKRHETLGLDAASFGEIALAGVEVGSAARLAQGDVVRGALRFFAKRAVVNAARAVGVARFAYDIAREYCDTRKAFGKPIGHFQAVAFTLADRLMDVESSRWLVWRAAQAWDAGLAEEHCLKLSAQGAAHALEACMRAADDCVGLHGGSGFIRDLIAEKLMRDAKMLALCGPTPEQLDQLATWMELGAPIDAALVLPTPDTQAIYT